MHTKKLLIAALILFMLGCLAACKKKEPEPPKPKDEASAATQPAAPAQPSPNDAMTAQLRKVAGADANDCGTVPGQGDVQSATACAVQSNDAKKPFWVRYELPLPGTQMSIATARNAEGKLFTVQYSSDGYKKPPEGGSLSDDKKIMTLPCPDSPLRIAGSGRVTCFAPQQNAGQMASPHGGGMAMPPASGPNPHGKMPTAPGANPHGKPQSNDALDKSH